MELDKLMEKDFLQIVPKSGTGFLTLSQTEKTEILKSLYHYSQSNNENIPEDTLKSWVDNFQQMGLPAEKIIKAIKRTELNKTYSVTKFSDFIDAMKKENILFTYAEMMRESRKRAERIFITEFKEALNKIEIERNQLLEIEAEKVNIEKFLNDKKIKDGIIAQEKKELLEKVLVFAKDCILLNDLVKKIKLILNELN